MDVTIYWNVSVAVHSGSCSSETHWVKDDQNAYVFMSKLRTVKFIVVKRVYFQIIYEKKEKIIIKKAEKYKIQKY